jgi:hypothetical protein
MPGADVQAPSSVSASMPSLAEQNQSELQPAADDTAQSSMSTAASAHPVAEDAATAQTS